MPFEINANAFSKCSPAISNTLAHCGSVALCEAIPLTSDTLPDTYMTPDGDMRVMDALLLSDFEINQCEANQEGWFELLSSLKVNMSHRAVPMGIHQKTQKIAPFLMADQLSPINNEFWSVSGGNASGPNWEVQVTSPTNIPASVRRFPIGRRVFITGTSDAGSTTHTAWAVVSSVDNNDNTLTLVLSSLNANSFLDADKLESPVTGWLRVGVNNVDDYEKECNEMPTYLNNKEVPFWMQTERWSYCDSDVYNEYRGLMMQSNALYRKFFDLPETKRNQQLMRTHQKDWVNQFFLAKPLANQTLATYTSLEDIEAYDGDDLGVDGGICVGKRAEATGVIEQLAECGRVVDLGGDNINLPALFRAFYDILRVRESNGNRNKIIDVFMDTFSADLLNQIMWKYYSSKIADHNGDAILRANKSIDGPMPAQKANFGFLYRSYPLDMPMGATMNVITHYSFDDELDIANQSGQANAARKFWVLDFSGIRPGIVASNRVVADTGALKALAAMRQDFSCVMKVNTRKQSLFSQTYAVIIDCPKGNLIMENFESFDWEKVDGLTYPSSTTTSTTGT